jgi:hypothetical protein
MHCGYLDFKEFVYNIQFIFQGSPYRIMMMNKEDSICWFHGKVSREAAEQILRNGNMLFKN